ncbi:hypothetical protein EUX98_g4377 [Antrodiella citrinella]|uniref:Polyketide synthase phosphopantetheine-binding domain-containing protein n=1 Tax=Antrodiella citrinella TaxID=2447956 RepID=A0A4S4MU58_9APHY|nr:hypothetical protein EUX98_g4377 [Antrodiella citrinella]
MLQRGDITIPDLYDWNAVHNPSYPVFTYHDGVDGPARTISWSQTIRMIHSAAHFVAGQITDSSRNAHTPPVIAVLASSVIGIMRAGLTVFAVSPRNSPEALAHLLSKTDATLLLTSSEPSTTALAESGLKILQSTGKALPTSHMPAFERLFSATTDDTFVSYPNIVIDINSPALILHSSGSTAFPKAVYWTHRGLNQWCRTPFYGTTDLMSGAVIACHAMPLYHGMGALMFCATPACGCVMAVFPPRSPAIFPTSENLFDALKADNCDLLACVPMFLEQWSMEPNKIPYLKTVTGLMFGGGPLSKHAGDLLTAQGVTLYQIFGLSETSIINDIFVSVGSDWEYMRIAPEIPHVYVPREEGKSELLLLSNDSWSPSVINAEYSGVAAYATSDLFTPHPTKPELWKIFGRSDDQIMLSTGEKTNPGPLEHILNGDPHIQCAIMFGRGRPQNGVLVELKSEYAIDPEDTAKLAAFRDAIWPTVERINEFAPQHSRLFKEMILVARPSKPFSYTAKNTPRRQAIINEYEPEINELYEGPEKSGDSSFPVVSQQWNEDETVQFIRGAIMSAIDKTVGDDDDIFQYGCDSLRATWIHNKVLRALRSSDAEAADRLPTNFVFLAPTVTSMKRLLLNTVHPSLDTLTEVTHIAEIEATVAKYTTEFPARPESLHPRPGDGDVVFVTGTTGGYGCNILAQLSHDSRVKKVYAFNRPSDDILPRQLFAMQRQGLLEDCLRASKFEMVEGDLSKPNFGLDPAVYEKLRTSVTHVIHNAWPVDFNLTLQSFERSLQGVRGLTDFALSSPFEIPPQILFVSSIGIFRQPESFSPRKEEPVLDPAVVVGTGYAESKWVAEQILAAASERTGLRTVSVRIGQLCGDRNGHWNEKEWFPSIVKSALYVKCLPDVPEPGLVSWIPSYEGAKAIIAMRDSDERVLHLVNPNPVPWKTFLEPLAEAMNVSLVPYDQWLYALGECLKDTSLTEVENMQRNPALRLLDFYRGLRVDDELEPLGLVRLETTKGVQVAPSLQEMPLSQAQAERWMASWRSSGFVPAEKETEGPATEVEMSPRFKL